MSPSNSHHSRRDHHHDRNLDDLIRRYSQTTQPSPILADILRSTRDSSLLVSALRRQVSLIKCRSQDPRDNQVTVYDRALMELSHSGDDPRHLGALELYLTEYWGIVPIAPFTQGRDVARECVELEEAFCRARETDPNPPNHNKKKKKRTKHHTRSSHSPSERRTASPHHHHNHHHHHSNTNTNTNKTPTHPSDQLHTRISRLLDTYQTAKDEYFGSLQQSGMVSIDAARFLRDTAENTLRYLQSNGLAEEVGSILVAELEYTFAAARDKATELSGGRKRHFDEGGRGSGGGSGRTGGKRSRRAMMDSYRPEV